MKELKSFFNCLFHLLPDFFFVEKTFLKYKQYISAKYTTKYYVPGNASTNLKLQHSLLATSHPGHFNFLRLVCSNSCP